MSKGIRVEIEYDPYGIYKYHGVAYLENAPSEYWSNRLADRKWDWKINEWWHVRQLIKAAEKRREKDRLQDLKAKDPNVGKRVFTV